MNIYLFELKTQLKSFLIWVLSLLLVLFAFMSGIYPIFHDSLDTVQQMLRNFPPQFAAAFGLHVGDLFSYQGFFTIVGNYVTLIGAIMATALAVGIFAREKRSKCADFLLSKPRGRGSIFLAKLLAVFTMLAAANIVYVAAALALYRGAGQDAALTGQFMLAAGALFFTQLVFLGLGVFFATFAKKVRSVSGIATAFGFGGFILSALASLLQEEGLRFIAPLKYFDPSAVFARGGFEAKYVLTAVAVIVVCIGASYIKFCKSDAHAV